MKKILVKSVVGCKCEVEDAIIIKHLIENDMDESVVLDFNEVNEVPVSFFANLLTDMINIMGRDYIVKHLHVNNLSNKREFDRVLLGTAFAN